MRRQLPNYVQMWEEMEKAKSTVHFSRMLPHCWDEFGQIRGSAEDFYKGAIVKETEQSIKELTEEHRLDGRPDPNERQIQAVKEKVKEKYERLNRFRIKRDTLWDRSERLLNLLRSKGQTVPLSERDMLQAKNGFYGDAGRRYFVECEKDSPTYLGKDDPFYSRKVPVLPNLVYGSRFPGLVGTYGFPFFELMPDERPRQGQESKRGEEIPIGITGINTLFWAAFLGGDRRLRHDVVFYVPEKQFYFYDLPRDCYFPTSEEKVSLGLALALQECAMGQEEKTAKIILERFCSKEVLIQIVQVAKSILAAESNFFAGPNGHRRWKPEDDRNNLLQSRAEEFVKDWIMVEEGSVASLNACLCRFSQVCGAYTSSRDLKPFLEKSFQKRYPQNGLRNDLHLADGTGVKGWKGLRLKEKHVATVPLALESEESGLSVPSERRDLPTSPSQAIALAN